MTDLAMLEPELVQLFEAPARRDDAFGIYVHIPFCTHICPYCDFNTYAGKEALIPAYVDALKREMPLWQHQFHGRITSSIFFGGGTPSLLSAGQIGDLLHSLKGTFDISAEVEITIETNPQDLTERYCSEILEAGVKRISIGAQTLDRRGLRVLGRLHEAAQVSSAVAAARGAGCTNLSLDLIYGWPGQTRDRWRDDLNRILAGEIGGSVPDHLSLYGLIVEPGTPMADAVHRGILRTLDDDTTADYSDLASVLLAEAGWVHYEIANWCSSPDYASRHNAIYWRNGDYAGIGAGAHGHVSQTRTMNQPSPRRFIEMLASRRSPRTNTERIDAITEMSETMMLGLRLLQDGISRQAFAVRHGRGLSDQFGMQIDLLSDLGLLKVDERSVRLTERGAQLANSVSAEFL